MHIYWRDPYNMRALRFKMAHFMNFVYERLGQRPSSSFMRPFEGSLSEYRWGHITCEVFLGALGTAASYWKEKLTASGAKQGDIVGLWYACSRIHQTT